MLYRWVGVYIAILSVYVDIVCIMHMYTIYLWLYYWKTLVLFSQQLFFAGTQSRAWRGYVKMTETEGVEKGCWSMPKQKWSNASLMQKVSNIDLCASSLKPLLGFKSVFAIAGSSVGVILNYQAKLQSLFCVIARGSQKTNFPSRVQWTVTLGLREQQ